MHMHPGGGVCPAGGNPACTTQWTNSHWPWQSKASAALCACGGTLCKCSGRHTVSTLLSVVLGDGSWPILAVHWNTAGAAGPALRPSPTLHLPPGAASCLTSELGSSVCNSRGLCKGVTLPTSRDWQGSLVACLVWGLFLWAFFSPRLSFNVCLH